MNRNWTSMRKRQKRDFALKGFFGTTGTIAFFLAVFRLTSLDIDYITPIQVVKSCLVLCGYVAVSMWAFKTISRNERRRYGTTKL